MATVPIRAVLLPPVILPVRHRTIRSNRRSKRDPVSNHQPVHHNNRRHSRIYSDLHRSRAEPNLLIQVLPIRVNQEATSMVLRISMDQVARQANIHRDNKVNIHPLVDRCIHHTGHRNLAKEGQPLRRRVQLHRHPPIRTEAMAVAHTLHRHSSDLTVSNRRQSVLDRRRHPRPDHRVLPVNHRSAVHPDSNLRLPLPRARDIQQPHNHHSNRTTTGQISLISRGGIPTLRRINSRTHPTNSDRRCILAAGREVQVSTVDSIPRKDLSNSGEPTTDPVRVVHPARLVFHPELPEHQINGVPTPIGILRISNRRIRLINRLSSNPGPRCHQHHKARRCDHRSEVANHLHQCNKQA